MAHQPMFRPDPFEHSEIDEPLFALENGPQESDVHRLAAKLAGHMDGASSGDLALDLVLNEIVQQARLATTANGAAIALFRDGEMVCRASTGASAPDLGTRLNTRAGLSGACLRTKQVQRCDDTETDPRVDGEALRDLDVRSILVVPIQSEDDLVGIFEILSPRPNAFGDRDVLTLEALSRRIVRDVERIAFPPPAAAPSISDVNFLPAVLSSQETVANGEKRELPNALPTAEALPARRDYWTGILTAVVIALALLLGWMVGYAGWQRAVASRTSAPTLPARRPSQDASAQPVAAIPKEQAKLAPKPVQAKATSEGSTPGGLVVTQNGKVIFEMPPEETAASTVKAAGGADGSNTRTLAPEVAETYLLRRIEPEYPESAKQAQALGPVILELRVGKDGAVRQANLVSGDALLVPSAVAAVRQWKYQPYSPDGNPKEFLTRVTVNFKAP